MSVSRNTIYNLVGAVLPTIATLVLIPPYIDKIGHERYAVLAIVWLFLSYFGFFDFGMGKALARRIALLRSVGSPIVLVVGTALRLSLALGSLGAVCMLPLMMYYFTHHVEVSSGIGTELRLSIPWLLLALPLATLLSSVNGALQGCQRFLYFNITNSLGSVLFQALPFFVAVFYSSELNVLLPAAILARSAVCLIALRACMHDAGSGVLAAYDRSEARELLSFGGWVTVSAIVGPLMVVGDRFVIATELGAKALTHYIVPFQIAERTPLLAGALAMSMFPRIASSSVSETASYVARAVDVLYILTAPLFAVGIVCSVAFLSVWISPEFAGVAAVPFIILLVAFWVNCFAQLAQGGLVASGRPRIVSMCHILEAGPYFLMLYLLVGGYGLTGAALAFLFRVVVDLLLLSFFLGLGWRALVVIVFTLPWLAGAGVLAFNYGQSNIALVALSCFLFMMGWVLLTARRDAKQSFWRFLILPLRRRGG